MNAVLSLRGGILLLPCKSIESIESMYPAFHRGDEIRPQHTNLTGVHLFLIQTTSPVCETATAISMQNIS